ncbi:Hypothetical protein NTJ_10424 [Nesidiocoris tenuis]|uniref:Uncharacterized protein n=1 Tax=Nesidiocoris tenuis TaxID=355587 RepID=A0ABN7AZK7_9HEMI|nr:Hypothetical protein NTJ_10424 [Nesidiocoris tenuis]
MRTLEFLCFVAFAEFVSGGLICNSLERYRPRGFLYRHCPTTTEAGSARNEESTTAPAPIYQLYQTTTEARRIVEIKFDLPTTPRQESQTGKSQEIDSSTTRRTLVNRLSEAVTDLKETKTIINGKVRCPPGFTSDLNGKCKENV